MAVQHDGGQEIYEYFGDLSTSAPPSPRDDILSRFVTAEIDGERLTRDEILDICFLFLIAGLDTVSDSLTCFFAFLATAPRAPPAASSTTPTIIPTAVEELLRWESPVPPACRVRHARGRDCSDGAAGRGRAPRSW